MKSSDRPMLSHTTGTHTARTAHTAATSFHYRARTLTTLARVSSALVLSCSISTVDDHGDEFRVDMKEQEPASTSSSSKPRPPATKGSNKSKPPSATTRHPHFETTDTGSHEHGGYHYSNGHSTHSDTHSHSHSGGATKGDAHGHSHGPRAVSPIAGTGSPKMSPRACGGLGPREQRKVDKAGKKIEKENAAARKKLWCVSVLCLAFMVLEIIGGFLANSLAIMTDAAHLLSDLASFLISIFALWLATRAPTSRLSFGFHRAEILGALISVIMIWLLTGILVYEAVQRIREPEDVDGKYMFIVATCGLGVNLLMGFILYQSGHQHSHGLGGGGHGHSHGGGEDAPPPYQEHDDDDDEEDDEEGEEEEEDEGEHEEGGGSHGHSHSHGGAKVSAINSTSYQNSLHPSTDLPTHRKAANINVSAAFVHVLGDALQSVGVMIAAALIWYNKEWAIADPICTFIFSLLVLFTTARLVKQSVGVLMEGAPDGIDPSAVEQALHGVKGVLEVHDLHVWSLSVGKPSLSVHLLARKDEDTGDVLREATLMLGKKYNIHHSTIQVEREGDEIYC